MLRACDCHYIPCEHNPPKGMIAVRRRNKNGWWFVNEKMNWLERLIRRYFKGYIL